MKKILTIIIAVALVAAIAVGGTLAYLTSTADNTVLQNTFVSDNTLLDITLNEAPVDSTTGLVTAGNRVTTNNYPIIPGEIMDKDPLITVKSGSQPCYVFAYVTNDIKLTAAAVGSTAKSVVTSIDIPTATWTQVASSANGVLYVYSNASVPLIVAKSASDQALTKVFTKITINKDLTTSDLKGTKSGSITVKAYAHQATASVTYADALAAAKALFSVT